MAEGRRGFLRLLGAAPLVLANGARHALAGSGRYGIAYTSFAVRLQRWRDLTRGAGEPALPADAFFDLCRAFAADGCQVDVSQLASTEPSYLDGLKRRLAEAGLFVELSVAANALEDEQRFAAVAAVAGRLGATRLRVALLNGRRYEDFRTREAWHEFADHWRRALPRAKAGLDRHRLAVGIENHKDWRSDELVDLIRSVDSPYLGACIDFGNNLSLLEDPLETVTKLAPYAVTTHLKDMAVRSYDRGFEMSEVPLGTGICPLAQMIAVIRSSRPEAPLVLEMITRDPLKIPCHDDVYWATYPKRDEVLLERFRATVLARAQAQPLPRVSGLGLEAMVAAEDENVRRSTTFARQTLGL